MNKNPNISGKYNRILPVKYETKGTFWQIITE
jgi:hypothetical protein